MTGLRGFLLASTGGALLAAGSMIAAGEALAQQAGQERAIVPMNHFEVQGDKQIVFAAREPMESMAAYNEGDYEPAMSQQQRQQ